MVTTIIAKALLAFIIFLRCRLHVKLQERIGLLRNKRQTDTEDQKPSTSNMSYAKAISNEYKEKEISSYENISEIVTELLTPNTVRQDLALAIDDKITILMDKGTRTNENIQNQEIVEKFRNVLDS